MTIKDDIRNTNIHIPKQIMQEVYQIEPNPRYTTLLLFLEHNYPQYNNQHDAYFIWDHAHSSDQRLLQHIN